MGSTSKIVSVYSNSQASGKSGYAINLATSIYMLERKKTLLVDMESFNESAVKLLREHDRAEGSVLNLKIGVDVLRIDTLTEEILDRFKREYEHIVINLPVSTREAVYEGFVNADIIHFFLPSIKEHLEQASIFIKNMPDKGLRSVSSKIKIIINRLNIFDKLSIEEISWLLRKNVDGVVPEPGIMETLVDSESRPLVVKVKESPYSRAVKRIAKSETGKTLGLALGSGAAFGLAHIGVLKILEKENIEIDVVSGSSIGSLIAALWGIGYSSEKIELISKKLRNKLTIMRLVDFTFPVSGILVGRRLKRFLKSFLGEKTFEDLKIPVKIMVYDLANRETIAIEKGSLLEAVYRSISVPGIFEPTVEKERVIIDGGVSDPVPVDVLLKEKIKRVIAVNVLPGPDDIFKRNRILKKRGEEEEALILKASFFIKILIRTKRFLRKLFTPNLFDVIMTSMMSMEYMLAETSCAKASVTLHPVYSDATSVDFHKVKEFVKVGERETIANIGKIKELTV